MLCLPPGAVGEQSVGIACFIFETHAPCILSHSAVLLYFIYFILFYLFYFILFYFISFLAFHR